MTNFNLILKARFPNRAGLAPKYKLLFVICHLKFI
jgi:hypothetical protein